MANASMNESSANQAQTVRLLKNERRIFKSQITSLSNALETYQDSAKERVKIRERVERLRKLFDNFYEIQDQLGLIEDFEQTEAEREAVTEQYDDVIATAITMLQDAEQADRQPPTATKGVNNSPASSTTSSAIGAHLPKIDLPRIDGRLEKRVAFKDDEGNAHPEAAGIIKRDPYVDDLLTDADTMEEPRHIQHQIGELLQPGGLNIRQWASNEPALLKGLREDQIHPKILCDDTTMKALGISWDARNDAIRYAVEIQVVGKVSKRTILSTTAKIFDPLGLLGPVTIIAKILIQHLWQLKIDWDESLPASLYTEWTTYAAQLNELNDIEFNRCVTLRNHQRLELHGFCDSSERAYGACMYVRTIDDVGRVETHLLCAKSRVAPLKTVTLERLELRGAVLLASLVTSIQRAISVKIHQTFLWTDSTIVLNWINTQPFFTCFATKAVHLEVAGDLTTEGFIAALKRFIARRGLCRNVYSDNGTNFVGADTNSRHYSNHKDEQLRRFVTDKAISWHFMPALSPHFGGLWEAAVKSFKHHVKRVVGDELFTLEQFNTFVIEVEANLNSRPLTPLSADPNDPSALTPGHFLIGDSFTSLAEIDFSGTPTNRLSTWQHIQKVKRHFWARWHKEYIHHLNERHKWTTGTHHIREGTVVVMKEDNLPPLAWHLGRVVATHPGADGVIRAVTVRTSHGTYRRNVRQLAPLPDSESD
ncbi:uncharacterized protein LOC143174337 [Nomia melanderi]|uniref:uncharacterized protein LOC143174337 n=1 Tax=Nomia melanderi TaxID=2448451 RepID=UPI003FCC9394